MTGSWAEAYSTLDSGDSADTISNAMLDLPERTDIHTESYRSRPSHSTDLLRQGAGQNVPTQSVPQSKRPRTTSAKRSGQRRPQLTSSPFKGVTLHRNTGRYEAHLWDADFIRSTLPCGAKPKRRKGRQLYLGAYVSPHLAARAYDKAAIKKWGQAAEINFDYAAYSDDLALMDTMTFAEYVCDLKRGSAGFSRGRSTYRGVTKHHSQRNQAGYSKRAVKGRWEARIGRVDGGKYKYLGTFLTERDAAVAYDKAVMAYRGAKAVTNFPIHDYMGKLVLEDVSRSSQGSSEPADDSEGEAKQQQLSPHPLSPDFSDLSGWSASGVQPIMADAWRQIASETSMESSAEDLEAPCPPLLFDGPSDEDWQQFLDNIVPRWEQASEGKKGIDAAVDEAEAMLIDVSPIHHQDPDDIIRSFNVLLPAGC